MRSFEIERNQTNAEALDAEIRNSLGDAFKGMSTRPGIVTLYFADEATGTQMQEARDMAVLHDPAVLSPRQEQEVTRRQAMVEGRQRHEALIDVRQFKDEPASVKTLAERVAWLEQEIRDLRGL